jgi:hypothetical protein
VDIQFTALLMGSILVHPSIVGTTMQILTSKENYPCSLPTPCEGDKMELLLMKKCRMEVLHTSIMVGDSPA